MRQRIYTPPFHRRILPWIFIVIFFAIAPIVLFYTSGYRWSSQKGQIERNGTIIIDSTPTKATLSIDGRATQNVTPITLQDMPPGLHRFRLDKAGYHSWEKSLEVTSERVTFANDLWLWRDSEPMLTTAATSPLVLSSSTDGRQILVMSQATSSLALLLTAPDQISSSSTLAVRVNATSQLNWSPTGRHLIVQTTEGTSSTRWIIDTRNTNAPLIIPDGPFRWDPDALVIQNTLSQIRIQLSDFSLRRVPFASHIVDTSTQATIRSNDTTGGLIFIEAQNINKGIELPSGAWHLWSSENGMHILRDGNRWMSVQLNPTNASRYEVAGDRLRPFTSGGITQYLLINQNEIWIWNPTTQPELIYRQSERIIDAAWHSENGNIFFATRTGVFALNLDQRDGRIVTQLAAFDEITGLGTVSSQLVITGTKKTETGIWTLVVE